MHIFGLTGGIGSGKSTVARRLRARGVPVIDADELAREAVEVGSPALAEIVAAFGSDVLTDSGALDRKKLAAHVFNDAAARTRLNSIVHPRVRELSAQHFAELAQRGEPLACYEVPLLVEVGLTEALRPLVVVSVPEDVQVARAMQRDGSTEAEARARVAAQMPLARKAQLADFVIDNSGSIADTDRCTDQVLSEICECFQIDETRYPKP